MPRESTRLPEILIVVAVLGAGAYLGWRHHVERVSEPPPTAAASAPGAPAPAAPTMAPPAIQYPIEPPAADGVAMPSLPPLADADPLLREALTELVGRRGALGFLQLDGFVRRVVATVDNLARAQAPTSVWPVHPTPGRFQVLRDAGGGETIHPDNRERYAGLVRAVEAVDIDQAVALYRRLYPLFQQAYEELGYPDRHFNDRLVQVLDHLIATPVPASPPAVRLVEVKGPVPSSRPWVRYEYADPALEAMSAGQKILLRVGADQQTRLQARLKALRERVTRRPG